jgi:hypothetical protein
MRAPADLVRQAFDLGQETGVTHILAIYTPTEYSPDDWSIEMVNTPEDLQERLAIPGSFYQLREVYSTRLPIDEQLFSNREAWFVV